ncbi:MAG: hypothetical protein ACNS62_19870 [Candidatus Cyclobacteriaceae bacterium M3_2C_046]
MKKKILFLLLFAITFGFTWANEDSSNNNDKQFVFYQQLENARDVEIIEGFLTNNYLGNVIAEKLYVLQELYTYEVEGSATSPGVKTVVEKPEIYYSLKKLNNHYKKMVKKDRMTMDQAVEEYSNILNIGISIVYQKTDEFEQYLRNFRKPEEIKNAYANVTLEE